MLPGVPIIKITRKNCLCHLGEEFVIDFEKIFVMPKLEIVTKLVTHNLYENPISTEVLQMFCFVWTNSLIRGNIKREKQKILFDADVRCHCKRMIEMCNPTSVIFDTKTLVLASD
jgi:hypothetical protein